MKHVASIILSLLLLVGSSFAATNGSDIQLNFTSGSYVNLVGSAVDSVHNFSFNDIDNKTVSLGNLGLVSNNTANCTVKFSSKNNYKLRHTITNDLLTNYTVKYKNTDFSNPWWTPTLYTSCNTAATMVEMTTPALPSNIGGGIYQDIITVIVATQ